MQKKFVVIIIGSLLICCCTASLLLSTAYIIANNRRSDSQDAYRFEVSIPNIISTPILTKETVKISASATIHRINYHGGIEGEGEQNFVIIEKDGATYIKITTSETAAHKSILNQWLILDNALIEKSTENEIFRIYQVSSLADAQELLDRYDIETSNQATLATEQEFFDSYLLKNNVQFGDLDRDAYYAEIKELDKVNGNVVKLKFSLVDSTTGGPDEPEIQFYYESDTDLTDELSELYNAESSKLNESLDISPSLADPVEADELRKNLFFGTISTNVQMRIYLNPNCYIEDDNCNNFMEKTYPWLLSDHGYWFGAQIIPMSSEGSSLTGGRQAHTLACVAEQDATREYLDELSQMKDKQELFYEMHNSQQSEFLFLTETEEGFFDIFLNTDRFTACMRELNYDQMQLDDFVELSYSGYLANNRERAGLVVLSHYKLDKPYLFNYPTVQDLETVFKELEATK